MIVVSLLSAGKLSNAQSVIQNPNGNREVVLVLDSSGSMRNKPIIAMKKAAIKFCEKMIDTQGTNEIAIVSYNASVNKVLEFTSDIDDIRAFVNSMTANGGTNIADSLDKARCLLDDKKSTERNIVLLTDGIPENGPISNSGRYDDIGPSYSYHYGNFVYDYCVENIKDDYNLYTLGFFHSLSGSNLKYAQKLLQDIQNSGYYEVSDPDKLVFTFGEMASDIVESGDEKECPIIIVPGIMGNEFGMAILF